MMKVLYITHTTSLTDGSTKSFLNLIEGLQIKGIIPLVVCPNKEGLYKYLQHKNIDVVYVKYRFNMFPTYKSLKDFLLFIPRILATLVFNILALFTLYFKVLKDVKPDIIHTNVSVINIGYYISRIFKIKHVWHIREYQDVDFGIKTIPSKSQFSDMLNRHNDNCICITADIKKSFNLEGSNTHVIYNGIKSSKDLIFDSQKENYFLFTGRVEKAKGLYHVVKAYISFIENNNATPCKLQIAGKIVDPEYYTKIISLIKAHSAMESIVFLGEVENVDYLMQKAKALIVGSLCEGFGRITSEAMFNGCLVIGNNTGGTKEQFDNGLISSGKEIGLRYHNEAELTQELTNIFKNGIQSYYPMILRSQRVVSELYSTQSNISHVYRLYLNVLENQQ